MSALQTRRDREAKQEETKIRLKRSQKSMVEGENEKRNQETTAKEKRLVPRFSQSEQDVVTRPFPASRRSASRVHDSDACCCTSREPPGTSAILVAVAELRIIVETPCS